MSADHMEDFNEESLEATYCDNEKSHSHMPKLNDPLVLYTRRSNTVLTPLKDQCG
jgi:hypothetical protein